MKKSSLMSLSLALWGLSLSLSAGIPQTLNYQGRLRQNIAGFPVVPDALGNTVTFNIWPTLSGGTIPLWTETYLGASNGVSTVGGLFNVALGSVTPLTLPFDQPYFLEIVWTNSVGAAETMSPRQPLTTAPYAFNAQNVVGPVSVTGTGAGSAVFGSDTPGIGVLGVGQTGTAGSAGAPGGIGVLAGDGGQGGGALALKVSGSSIIGNSGSTATFTSGSTVNFTGATVNGLSAGIPNPLTLNGNVNLGPVIYGSNSNSSGYGVKGSNTFAGNDGYLGTGTEGVYGAGAAGAYGVHGFAATGIGVGGQGLTGTVGSAHVAGGIGVLADNGGTLANLALKVNGSSNIGIAGSTATFASGSTVNFTGATVSGLSPSVPNPPEHHRHQRLP